MLCITAVAPGKYDSTVHAYRTYITTTSYSTKNHDFSKSPLARWTSHERINFLLISTSVYLFRRSLIFLPRHPEITKSANKNAPFANALLMGLDEHDSTICPGEGANECFFVIFLFSKQCNELTILAKQTTITTTSIFTTTKDQDNPRQYDWIHT